MHPLDPRDPESIGDFTLVGRLGSGGMGVVYLASRRSQTVALKVVRESFSDSKENFTRFEREIKILEGIQSPNVARIVESDVSDDLPWFAAEFVNGPNLKDLVTDEGPLDEDRWWALAEGLLRGLADIHAMGVIHRDIKPANIILAESGPKVIDFGVAHISDATSVTATGLVAGSPAWFSPEQIEGLELTPATDVFSAGSVLTFAASGSAPWGPEVTMTKASVFKILVSEPEFGRLTPRQRFLVQQMLDKEPGNRPTAAFLLGQLNDFRDSKSSAVLETPESPKILEAQNQAVERADLPSQSINLDQHRSLEGLELAPRRVDSSSSKASNTGPSRTRAKSAGGIRKKSLSVALAGFAALLLIALGVLSIPTPWDEAKVAPQAAQETEAAPQQIESFRARPTGRVTLGAADYLQNLSEIRIWYQEGFFGDRFFVGLSRGGYEADAPQEIFVDWRALRVSPDLDCQSEQMEPIGEGYTFRVSCDAGLQSDSSGAVTVEVRAGEVTRRASIKAEELATVSAGFPFPVAWSDVDAEAGSATQTVNGATLGKVEMVMVRQDTWPGYSGRQILNDYYRHEAGKIFTERCIYEDTVAAWGDTGGAGFEIFRFGTWSLLSSGAPTSQFECGPGFTAYRGSFTVPELSSECTSIRWHEPAPNMFTEEWCLTAASP